MSAVAVKAGDPVRTTIRLGPRGYTLRVLEGTYLGRTPTGSHRVLTATGEVTVHPSRVAGTSLNGAK